MTTLLRFAIKKTRESQHTRVAPLPVTHQDPDVSSALAVLEKHPSEKGVPKDIDKAPNSLDYPSVSLKGTPWAAYSVELVKSLHDAPWKTVIVKSTTPSPFSDGHNFSVSDDGNGWHGQARIRTLAAEWACESSGELKAAEWDMDALNIEERAHILSATMTNVLFGYSTAETMNWIRQSHLAITGEETSVPQRVIDLIIVGRVMRPSIPMELQVKAKENAEIKQIVSKGGSGWSFESIASVALDEAYMESAPTTPREWCAPAPLGEDFHSDVQQAVRVVRKVVLKLCNAKPDIDLLDAWDEYATSLGKADIHRLHVMQHFPQVLNQMHMNGLPFSQTYHQQYKAELQKEAELRVANIIEHAPQLREFEGDLADFDRGYSDPVKRAIGQAFETLGLKLEYSSGHPRLPKIGEKELRGAGATQHDKTAPLFEGLVALARTKKRFEAARSLSEFAKSSKDGRIHSMFTPSTGTLRLSSSDPSAHQMPADQSFRNLVEADSDHSIIACDFSALDVRNGAALAIKAQRLWVKALNSGNLSLLTKDQDMTKALDEALRDPNPEAEKIVLERNIERIRDKAKQTRKWHEFDLARKRIIAYKAATAWLKIVPKAKDSEDGCWGALREAFQLDAEIHTYTGMSLAGENPAQLLEEALGKDSDATARKEWWANEAVRLGPGRRRGKIGNLSLMYGMTLPTFRNDAAKKFDQHWTLEEAQEVFDGWYNTFPEVELMNCITEMQAITYDSNGNRLIGYRLKDERKGQRVPLNIFKCQTLSGRVLYAEGLNAGLNYGNQGTGSDALMDAMVTLKLHYPEIQMSIINQVHDELVVMVKDPEVEGVRSVMNSVLLESAEKMTAPYGVPMELSTTVGKVWLKD